MKFRDYLEDELDETKKSSGMSKTQIRQQVQDKLMDRMRTALYDIESNEEKTEMEKQFRRIEKLFGYTKGSWNFVA